MFCEAQWSLSLDEFWQVWIKTSNILNKQVWGKTIVSIRQQPTYLLTFLGWKSIYYHNTGYLKPSKIQQNRTMFLKDTFLDHTPKKPALILKLKHQNIHSKIFRTLWYLEGPKGLLETVAGRGSICYFFRKKVKWKIYL